jgi:hypothetical protein
MNRFGKSLAWIADTFFKQLGCKLCIAPIDSMCLLLHSEQSALVVGAEGHTSFFLADGKCDDARNSRSAIAYLQQLYAPENADLLDELIERTNSKIESI